MTKKVYMKPAMQEVKIQQQHVVCASLDGNGMNKSLQSEQVSGAWSRGGRGGDWDDEE